MPNHEHLLVVFLATVVLAGCSKEPPVEKEVVRSSPAGTASVHQEKPRPNVSSSHQEEAARKTEPEEASSGTGSTDRKAQEAGSASREDSDQPSGEESSPLELEDGYRAVKATAPGGQGILYLAVPEEWKNAPARSSMRLVQLALPGASATDEAGELSVFYFGPSAGSVQMNINRWIGQFKQPDGSSSKEKAKTEEIQGRNYEVTLLDLSGTMAASAMPGMPPQPEKENYRLLAAIIQTSIGPWFVKATGPEPTMARWREAFIETCKSATLSSAGHGHGGSASAR